MRKVRQGDHNIQFQETCNHQEYQSTPFHTQVSGDKLCPLQDSECPLMASLKSHVFLTYY